MKLEKGKEMHRKIRKGKERRAQPLSVSGQRNVSIILQRQISPKQFPPATGDQRADENRDMQHITFEGEKMQFMEHFQKICQVTFCCRDEFSYRFE